MPTVAHPYPHPYRTCIVLGLMLAEWWEASTARSGTCPKTRPGLQCGRTTRIAWARCPRAAELPQPTGDLRPHGADALRWYFFANQPPWNSIIYSERAIKESIPEFLLRLWNVYSFFVIYANIDGFDPAAELAGDGRPTGPGRRWPRPPVIAPVEPAGGSRSVDLERAASDRRGRGRADGRLRQLRGVHIGSREFVDALSNWYVRRSRDRFWSGDEQSQDKRDAYWTLYECLLTVSKLIAPFVPFLAETMWRNLAGVFGDRAVESVHLCDYPRPDPAAHRPPALRNGCSCCAKSPPWAASARMNAKLKVRQPLALVEVILADSTHQRGWKHMTSCCATS